MGLAGGVKTCYLAVTERNYRYSPLFKSFPLYHFAFTKDLHEDLFSLTKRNLKRIFISTKKGKICKQYSVFVLQWPLQRPFSLCLIPNCQQEWHHQAPFPGTTLSIQHQATIALHCVSILALSQFLLCSVSTKGTLLVLRYTDTEELKRVYFWGLRMLKKCFCID